MAIRTFRDLIAWQRARDLAVVTYNLVKALPSSEQFAMAIQIRRAVTSVSANVAEGFGLGTQPAFLRHLRIARGSLFELASFIEVAASLQLLTPTEDWRRLWEETDRVLQGLIRSVERDIRPQGE